MRFNHIIPMLIYLFVFSFSASTINAQQNSPPSEYNKISGMAGLTVFSHKLMADDGVYPFEFSTRKPFAGIRLAMIRSVSKGKAFVYDLDIEFGNTQRYFYGHDYASGLLGFQFFLGPRWQVKSSPVYFHTLFGGGFLWIGGGEAYEAGTRTVNFVCSPCSGVDRLRYEYYNSFLANSSHIPGFPSVKQFIFGPNIGISLDYFYPIRLLVEYLPLLGGSFRNDYRLGLVMAFD